MQYGNCITSGWNGQLCRQDVHLVTRYTTPIQTTCSTMKILILPIRSGYDALMFNHGYTLNILDTQHRGPPFYTLD
jgi:hypothetical protein